MEEGDTSLIDRFEAERNENGQKILTYGNTRLILKETIGKGSFGNVKLGEEQIGDTKTTYAVKVMHKGILERQRVMFYDEEMALRMSNNLERVRNEIRIWTLLRNPNIVGLVRIINDPNNYKIYLLIHYCDCGQIMTWDIDQQKYTISQHLLTVLSSAHPQLFSDYSANEAAAKIIFSQIAQGLKYLHSFPIIHKDIKPDNILFSAEEQLAKITDFTTSEQIQSQESLCFNPPGTVPFQAPESMLSGKGFSGQKADVWAFGVCLFTMLNGGALPFWAPESELMTQLAIMQKEPVMPAQCSPEAIDLLTQLLVKTPQQRPSISEALSHPWFNLPR